MRVVMTEHARQFVTPLTFKEISSNAVATSMWNSNQEFNVEHIALANWADVFVVAPATANIIAKMAHGLADDLLSTTLLAAQAPIIVCPAMNTGMYENALTNSTISQGSGRRPAPEVPQAKKPVAGAITVTPCSFRQVIFSCVKAFFARSCGDMKNLRVLVTAAGTREPIDPVRYVGNRSSGKMGYAIAQAAADRGAEVTLVSGPSVLNPPANVKRCRLKLRSR